MKGAIPAGSKAVLNTPFSQVTPISTWDDGSVKHALVAGRADFTANTARTVAVSLGTPAAGAALSEANLAAANPQASVTYGAYGTVNLSSLLNTAAHARVEHAGPEYAAFQYIGVFPNDPSVRAVFYVQLWAGGMYRVRVVIENGTALATSTGKVGIATVTIAGVQQYSGSVAMPDGTRWDVVAANAPGVTATHNAAYLRASKLLPNYGYTSPSSSALSGLTSAYAPMARLNWEQDMGATGYTPGIGLLPHWDAMYAATGDSRALASSIAHSRAFGAYSVFYRNTTTKAMPKFSDFPAAYANSDDMTGNGQNSNRWENAHFPNAGYLAWLATGDRFHLETLQANAFAAWYTSSGGGQTGLNKLYVGQTRARAWRYRTIAALAAVAPDDDPFKGDAKASIMANLRHWKATNVDTNSPATGLAGTYDDQDPNVPGLQRSMFEHFFLVASVGWSWDQEMRLPTADKAVLAQVRDYLYRIPVGMTGRGQGSGEYCYRRGTGPYRTTVGPGSSSFYATWGQAYAATYSDSITCSAGSPIEGGYADDSGFPQGNWGHLMTALSYAVDHGAAGAAEGYARVTSASNWASNATKFNNWPQYGVVRR